MSLFGRAMARGFAGASAAVAGMANKFIDDELIQQRQQAFLDMARQSRNLERGDQLAFDTNPDNIKARNEAARSTALAAGQTAQEVELSRLQNKALADAGYAKAARDAEAARKVKTDELNDPALNEAARRKAADDSAAASKIKNDQTIADANNPQLLAAGAKVKLADPEIAARVAAARAAANSANASAGLHGAQAEGVKLTTGVLKKLDGLYEDMGKVLSDPSINDAERTKKMADIEKQITLMKARAGGGSGSARNPELDTRQVIEETDEDGRKTTKVVDTTRRLPGNMPERAQQDPVLAEAQAAIAKGADPAKVEARLQKMGKSLNAGAAPAAAPQAPAEPTRKDPISGEPLTRRAWDRKYGRGDFDNLYRKGEDSLKSF